LRAPPARGSAFLRAVGAVVWKDLAAELRSRELLGAMLVFALLVLLIFNFALELDVRTRSTITAGVLWVTFVFAGTLGLNRSMAVEKDRGCLDGLLLAPVDRSAIFFGKAGANLAFLWIVVAVEKDRGCLDGLLLAPVDRSAIFFGKAGANLAFLWIVVAVVLPVYSLLYNTNLFVPGLLGVIVLGTIGYVAVGTLLAAMAVQARTRDVLLPILLFPVVLPVLIPAVKASTGLLQGVPLADIDTWIRLLVAYDVIFVVVAWWVFDFVVEE